MSDAPPSEAKYSFADIPDNASSLPSEQEEPLAVTLTAEGVIQIQTTEVSEDEIIAYAKERLATFKCPTSVDWADVLPRNPSGKILKRELREPYWEGRDRRVG